MILHRFGTSSEAAASLAGQVKSALRSGLEQRGSASLVVPGGRTPLPLFHALRDADLDWARVTVTLTDERWVDEVHPASNAGLVKRELLQARAAAARFRPLFDGSDRVRDAVESVWRSLGNVPRPFDVVVLGMGDDGHFASLFPQSPGVAAALDPAALPACVAMHAPADPASRISLNLSALLESRRLFLFITGTPKRELLLAAARGDAEGLPVAALLAQRVPMPEVYWAP